MADDFFPVFAEWARKHGLSETEQRFASYLPPEILRAYVAEYENRMARIENDDPPVVCGPRDPWYAGPLDTDAFWPPLRSFFRSQLDWDEDKISPVDKSSTKVVAYTPNPNRSNWRAKGLVVGYVQSGKTTNFTSVIAKAADVGYKLVIVLSGIHNGLRRQTQERLDQQLSELSQNAWLNLTDVDNDFRSTSIRSTALLHGQEQKVALCVVKKNQAILRRLDRWLEDASTQRVLADLPTLVIDDEADQASVQTRTINPLIRRILEKLPRSTYIGYTATPFANVLIDPTGGDDLYPSDFILNLPRPDGYFGTERIFGRDAVEGEASGADLDGYDMVRIIDEDEIELLAPAGRDTSQFEPEVTVSLTAAIRWFWLATAARRARGDDGHSTMLVHTSVKIAVHEAFKDPLLDVRDETVQRLEADDAALLVELCEQWADETARVPAEEFPAVQEVSFDEVVAQLLNVVRNTRIILDNCRSVDRLDYSTPSQVAIAVGGNTLSRGLTLEGLVVSYFVRAAQAYDTLLQMARWFGFRAGYEDLPRIWMTDRLREWFRHLAAVEHEIRLDIERYEQQDMTPLEFGVRIRTHPVLRVTAKMGAARAAYASYGGRRVQTRYFQERDAGWLSNNRKAADDLIRAIRNDGGRPEPLAGGAALFRDVSADLVDRFLASYEAHDDSPDLDKRPVRAYIDKQRKLGSLDLWSVAVMAGESDANGTVSLGGLDFARIARSKLAATGPERADIKTLMSKDHRVVDLPIPLPQARAMAEAQLVDARNDDPIAMDRGLLLLYPINPLSKPDPSNKARAELAAVDDVIGLALVFPGNADDNGKIRSEYISVDLTDAEVEQPDEAELESLRGEGES
jgi:hypothetical protein